MNITAITLSETEIRVNWSEVFPIDRNGIITQYEVQYNQTNTVSFPMTNFTIVNAPQLSVILEGLASFVEYNITVRAYTVIGSGPFNPSGARNMTDASSKLTIIFLSRI